MKIERIKKPTCADLNEFLIYELLFPKNKFEKYDERQIKLYDQNWSRGILLSAQLDIISGTGKTEYDKSVMINLEDKRFASDIIRSEYILGINHSFVTQAVEIDINIEKFFGFNIYEKQIALGVAAIQIRRLLSISCLHQPPKDPELRVVSKGIEQPPSSYINNFVKSFLDGDTPNTKLTFAVADSLGLGC